MAFLDVLDELAPSDRMRVLAHAERREFHDGETVLEECVENGSIFFILDGEVAVGRASPTMSDAEGFVELARLGVGSVIGEMTFLTTNLTSAQVAAAGEVTVLSLSHRQLEDLMKSEPALAARFYRSLAVTLAHRLTFANTAATQRLPS